MTKRVLLTLQYKSNLEKDISITKIKKIIAKSFRYQIRNYFRK